MRGEGRYQSSPSAGMFKWTDVSVPCGVEVDHDEEQVLADPGLVAAGTSRRE